MNGMTKEMYEGTLNRQKAYLEALQEQEKALTYAWYSADMLYVEEQKILDFDKYAEVKNFYKKKIDGFNEWEKLLTKNRNYFLGKYAEDFPETDNEEVKEVIPRMKMKNPLFGFAPKPLTAEEIEELKKCINYLDSLAGIETL